jgi:phospholipid/cholesterol/gamma-HCH transport system ATP-binding protein
MEIIRVSDLDIGYGRTVVLRGLNFSIEKGRITVVIGESGSGKTSLMKTLIGLMPPLAGEMVLAGERIDFDSQRSLEKLYLRIGVLYQTGALLNSLTLYENVALPIRIHHREWPKAKEAEIVRTMLGRVGLRDGENKYPFALSGGMRKRGALARAMVLEPDLIFCDEPSSGLDPITSAGLDELLLDLKTSLGVTFVVVTHELRSIARIADRILVIRGEIILYDGEYADLPRSDDPYIRAFFLGKVDHDQ